MGDIALDFSRAEFACRCGCGFDSVDVSLLDCMVDLRSHFGEPVHINDACRCKQHNADVGGAPLSFHLLAKAADVTVKGIPPSEVASYLERRYPTSHGVFRYRTFTHVDVRAKKARGDFTQEGKKE